MRVLGVDPGSRFTGYGLVEESGAAIGSRQQWADQADRKGIAPPIAGHPSAIEQADSAISTTCGCR